MNATRKANLRKKFRVDSDGPQRGGTWEDRIADEHGRLRELMESVDDFLARPLPPDGLSGLVWLVSELAEACREHMEFEERGGYMAPVVERVPDRLPEAQALQHQHAELQTELREITQALESEPAASTFEDELNPRLRRWLRALRTHEHHENALVQRAFSSDLGVGD